MNFAIAAPLNRATNEFIQVLVEALPDGQFAAWAVALPDCRVVASSREGAIESLEVQLAERMKAIEIVELPTHWSPVSTHPVLKLAGALKDDADFAAWHDRFWADKQRIDDDEELTSIAELMGIL
jgi:hypothetical protein